jgi:uncharacterized membrane protein YphA (DoxX/SURF4 family)
MAAKVGKVVWIGRVLSWLVGAFFLFGALMKLKGGPEVAQGMAHLGLPDAMIQPLAILELTCTVIYLIPMTSVLGAILLAGYMGGAICVHWRVGDDFYTHIAIGTAVWLGVWLREARLRSLIPFRTWGT